MGDIAQRGNRLTFAKGGRAGFAAGASAIKGLGKVLKRISHEVPTGPHTDVRRRKINPSFLNPDVESGRTKEWRRKHGGFKNIVKDIVKGVLNKKDGGRIGLKKGKRVIGLSPVQQHYVQHGYGPHKRKGKAIGGAIKKVIQGGKKIISKIKKKPKTETWKTLDVPGMPGPHKGKYPAIDKVMKNLEAQKKKGVVNPHYTGKAAGGRIGKAAGGWTKHIPERKGPRGGHPGFTKESMFEHAGGGEKGKPHSSKEGRIAAGERNMRRQRERMKERLKKWKEDNPPRAKLPSPGRPSRPKQPWEKDTPYPKWDRWKKGGLDRPQGRAGLKKGGKADKNWIQKAVNPKHKGYCTPMTKKTCTPARKALARTFKKKAKTGW